MNNKKSQIVFGLVFTGFMMATIGTYAAETTVKTAAKNIYPCEKDMSFSAWLEGVRKQAFLEGVSARTWEQAKKYLRADPQILARDQNQAVFQQPFLQFSERMISNARINKARRLISDDQKVLFEEIQNDFGIPPEVITAIWALESDFSAFSGKFSILTATTTLGYDCRRSDMFRNQLIKALLVVERGDLSPDQMIGNWAGELGGAQFMPADYLESGFDYDHDGKVNLVSSTKDTLATVANYFVKHGWKKNQPWMIEVSLPKEISLLNQFPWQKADPEIILPLSQWKALGVKSIKGQLPTYDYASSLILPMGKNGPAFLTFENMNVFRKWNSSFVYSTTLGHLAARIGGANKVQSGLGPVNSLTTDEVIELQQMLLKLNYDIGQADGKLGAATRKAVQQVQLRINWPADSYPTQEFLSQFKKKFSELGR